MRKDKTITIDGEEITARELTVEDVANVMDGLVGATMETTEMLFPDRLPAIAVRRSTGLTEEQMRKMTPSQLDEIWQTVEGVNSFFADLAGRMMAIVPPAEQPPAGK